MGSSDSEYSTISWDISWEVEGMGSSDFEYSTISWDVSWEVEVVVAVDESAGGTPVSYTHLTLPTTPYV